MVFGFNFRSIYCFYVKNSVLVENLKISNPKPIKILYEKMSSRVQTTFLIFALVALLPNPKNQAHAYAADALETEMSTPTKIIKFLTAENFDATISNATDAPWIVFFGAPWCPHCQHFAPIYKDFALQANTKHDTLQLAAVNCSTQDSVCTTQGIEGYPTILMYDNQKFYTMTSSRTVAGLNDFATNFLTKSDQSGKIKQVKSLPKQVQKSSEKNDLAETPKFGAQELVVKGLMFFLLVFLVYLLIDTVLGWVRGGDSGVDGGKVPGVGGRGEGRGEEGVSIIEGA